MTIETEVASLTAQTTALLSAVNVAKTTLETMAASATTQASSAAIARTAIDNKYRGALAADPATRTDGTANQVGDEYFNTVTNRKMIFRATGWLDFEVSASASATASEVSRQVSVTQAGISTTQSGLATTAKTAAEAARDAASLIAPVHASTAAGIAATTNGQRFAVVVGSDIIFYENVSTVATERFRIKTAAFLNALFDDQQFDASGFAWAVVDSANNIAIAITNDGKITLGGQTDAASAIAGGKTATRYLASLADGSGYAYAITDANDNLAFAVLSDGRVLVAGRTVAPQSQVDTLNNLAIGTKTIVGWGDSLTEGSGSTGGLTYLTQLSTLLGGSPTVINEGFGSQLISQITARQGGNCALVTMAGNAIPASGSIAVTLDINILQYPTATAFTITGFLAGVAGVLSKDATSPGNYTFVRAVAGAVVRVAPSTPFLVTRSTRNTNAVDLDQAINLFWCGSNDVGSSGINTLVAQLDKSITKLSPNKPRYLILGPINNSAYTSVTQAYIDMRSATDAAKAKWPRRFIDIQSLLVESYNSAVTQDVTDYSNKVIPSSLRADAIHLNNAGYAIVASAVASYINQKGWLL